MRLWREDPTTFTGLEGLFAPKCKLCEVAGTFFQAKIGKFAINDGTNEPNSHHIDIEMTCPDCGYWWVYGVAISKDHYTRVSKEFDRVTK